MYLCSIICGRKDWDIYIVTYGSSRPPATRWPAEDLRGTSHKGNFADFEGQLGTIFKPPLYIMVACVYPFLFGYVKFSSQLSWVFSLLNCNTQIGTPTWGLRKPLLPCQTAYARVTFYEVPTRLPPRKLLQRSLYLTWCGHHSGSEEEEELEDDDFLDNLWKEGGNLIKRGALCHGK